MLALAVYCLPCFPALFIKCDQWEMGLLRGRPVHSIQWLVEPSHLACFHHVRHLVPVESQVVLGLKHGIRTWNKTRHRKHCSKYIVVFVQRLNISPALPKKLNITLTTNFKEGDQESKPQPWRGSVVSVWFYCPCRRLFAGLNHVYSSTCSQRADDPVPTLFKAQEVKLT